MKFRRWRQPQMRPLAFALHGITLATLACAVCAPALAASGGDAPPTFAAPTYDDWGGTGLWQTPTARMPAAGQFAVTISHVTPYTRYNFLLQPFDWMQVVVRYSDINNRPYGAASLSGSQTYKDKSIDARVRLWRESRYAPAVSVGIRDLTGTGLFSGEYVVASKRWGSVDASLGLGWGYLGARGNLPNPLDIFGSSFDVRPATRAGGSSGGEFNARDYFHGRTALFGGLSWQTPFEPLIVKLEYDGNNYQHEPLGDNQRQKTPWNVGVVYRMSSHADLSVAFERGTTALISLNLHANLADIAEPAKPLDPPPLPIPPTTSTTNPTAVDWHQASQMLGANAGIEVSKVALRGSELVVTGTPTRYYYSAETLGRMSRVLDQYLGPSVNWYTFENSADGMPIVDMSVDRKRFDDLANNRTPLAGFDRSVELDEPLPQPEQVLYSTTPARYHGAFSPGYQQTVGGPNAFVLYDIFADYSATYHFTPSIWWSGSADYNVFNNYSKFTYDAPSDLPRVRTHIREYLTTSRFTIPLFQLTAATRVAPNWYAMAYGGMLEMMYGGVGGEVLYRPLGGRWAVGADVNWVKQRAFDQRFSFQPYHVVTGMLTGYFDTGVDGVLAKVSVGRYLAGDWGGTLDLSRRFRNGVRIGAWATFTNVSAQRFGEGSFDKGIYVSIPFDLLLPRSTPSVAHIIWQPLLRDGGARLSRQYTLYDLTNGRGGDNFFGNLGTILQ